jgi:hypothetical protein
LIGWRLPSAASSQAPFSGGAFTPKDHTRDQWHTQRDFRGRELCTNSANRRSLAELALLGLTFF